MKTKDWLAENNISKDQYYYWFKQLRLAAAVWCAKECLYKMYGRRGMDLLRDLAVGSVDFARGTIRGTVAADAAGNAAGEGSAEGNAAGNVAVNVMGTVTVDMRMMITPDGHIIVYSV